MITCDYFVVMSDYFAIVSDYFRFFFFFSRIINEGSEPLLVPSEVGKEIMIYDLYVGKKMLYYPVSFE